MQRKTEIMARPYELAERVVIGRDQKATELSNLKGPMTLSSLISIYLFSPGVTINPSYSPFVISLVDAYVQ